uniref:EEF1A lysine methyltransferase 2 n=1 Tax=Ovis aries TaxID=9940 RepID=A0AC11EI58_SHEEP
MNEGADDGGGAGGAARSPGCGPEGDGFVPSALGTREHWDAVYKRELQTFQEYGDTGEIWFGEESMTRLIRWMQKHKIPLDASVLDIGTGNGVFLVELDLSLLCVGSSFLTREMEPRPPALGACSVSHWTTREVPEPPRFFMKNLQLSELLCCCK